MLTALYYQVALPAARPAVASAALGSRAQVPVDGARERRGADGLAEDLDDVGFLLEHGDRRVVERASGHDHDLDRAVARRLQAAQELVAALARHHEVRDDQVRRARLDGRRSLHPVDGGLDLEAFSLGDELDEVADALVVVD